MLNFPSKPVLGIRIPSCCLYITYYNISAIGSLVPTSIQPRQSIKLCLAFSITLAGISSYLVFKTNSVNFSDTMIIHLILSSALNKAVRLLIGLISSNRVISFAIFSARNFPMVSAAKLKNFS